MKMRSKQLILASALAEAVAWIVGSVATLWILAKHDEWMRFYWIESLRSNSLFLTQRANIRGPSASIAEQYGVWTAIIRYEADLGIGLIAASGVVVAATLARRLRDRRCWRGPGAVACVAALASMGLWNLEEVLRAAKAGQGLRGSPSNPFPNAWPLGEIRIGLAVIGAWVVMLGAGLWRPRATWNDRAGIAIGVLWLGVVTYRVMACLFIPFSNWGY